MEATTTTTTTRNKEGRQATLIVVDATLVSGEHCFENGKILLLSLVMLILMNVPYVRYVFYPFDIFATWIHEMCHGIAALFLRGTIHKLEIFADTSGLATYTIPNMAKRGFVTSAGYQGTAVVGFLLLIFSSHQTRPSIGSVFVGLDADYKHGLVDTKLVWCCRRFGFGRFVSLGRLEITFRMDASLVYSRLCDSVAERHCRPCLCCLAPIPTLMETPGRLMPIPWADIKGGSSWMWAIMWFCLALVMTLFGVVFAIPGPNEDPAFRCCGMCLDCGLFHICNATRKKKNDDDEATTSAAEAEA